MLLRLPDSAVPAVQSTSQLPLCRCHEPHQQSDEPRMQACADQPDWYSASASPLRCCGTIRLHIHLQVAAVHSRARCNVPALCLLRCHESMHKLLQSFCAGSLSLLFAASLW